ncbi:hypothetical protein KCP73_03780 [Salmonella enterica subsp. enterica]|nr:hypothetical protein KCP73_03780 [Salmonella enterica subsp. enterica]
MSRCTWRDHVNPDGEVVLVAAIIMLAGYLPPVCPSLWMFIVMAFVCIFRRSEAV